MSTAVRPFAFVAGDPNHTTDVGNAARFARDHAGRIRFCSKLGWFTWDTARYGLDDVGEVQQLARETIRGIYQEAAAATPDDRKRLALWAAESESRARILAMLSLAESEPGVATAAGAFDRHHWLLNTLSGVVDLKTAECNPHDPALLMTKLAPVFYWPEARCPKWLTFLDRIMDGNLDLIEFLQRAAGYSLTGSTGEQVFFMPWGGGANGKTTFLEVLRSVLGDYAAHTPAETLMVRPGGGGIPNDVARLRGARFVTAVETEDGRRLAEGLVKQITGGDTLTARQLYREFFEFRPEFKVWLATNYKPVIRGTDYAIWRRIRLVPFVIHIPVGERDGGLSERLVAEEGAAILAWCVEGCLQWQKVGLLEPEAVLTATQEYRDDMDPLTDFIEDRCELAEALEVSSGSLYEAYRAWAEANGRHPLSSKRLALALEGRSGIRRGRRKTERFFVGLGLRP